MIATQRPRGLLLGCSWLMAADRSWLLWVHDGLSPLKAAYSGWHPAGWPRLGFQISSPGRSDWRTTAASRCRCSPWVWGLPSTALR